MKTLQSLMALVLFATGAMAAPIDLSGEWRFALDPQDLGIKSAPDGWRFPDKIRLPGTVTAQGFGESPSFKTAWTGDGWRYPGMFKEWQADENFKFPFFLQPPKHYVGPAWYRRDIEIPADWKGSRATLHLERVHWQSTAWIDDKEVGQADSLGTPHEFDLGKLSPGKHSLTLRIDNRIGDVNVGPLSHSVTDHTQGNWNGVVGKIELRRAGDYRINLVRTFPSADGTVKLKVSGTLGAEAGEKPVISVRDVEAGLVEVGHGVPVRKDDGSFELEISAKVAKPVTPWNEFSPNLHRFNVDLEMGDDMPADRKAITFGFREIGHKDGRLSINGTPIFLRGTLECCIFPLTGHPPTDVDSWKRIIRICKAHGLNHIRFHSWCPPEAAFLAADELGFYYQVEVCSWANQGAEIGSGRPLDAWLEAESKRILDAYGNHPSFLMMAYGNEPAGGNHPKWLQDWVARRKAEDPRRFYTTASGWPMKAGSDYHSSPDPRIQAWGGGMKSIINREAPRTDFDWSDFVKKHSDAPVVSHEIGQWCVYPNFREIGKYTGYFKARNFEIFREAAKRSGLLNQADDFLKASGKLQVLAYKHDIEAALRTPGFGGFQLLDLHDFPGQGTALVGVLDAFWDEKGYITPAEYKRFCGPIVPLARMKKMVFTNAETLEADLEIAQFGPDNLKGVRPTWTLADSKARVLKSGSLPTRDLPTGGLHPLGAIRVPLDGIKAPAKLVLTVGAEQQSFSNSWEVFVYPELAPEPYPEGFTVTRKFDDAVKSLENGGKVVWMPAASEIRDDPARPLVAGFSPVFWNTAWTGWQPPHTLGVLCDPAHPALSRFPTDFHSNWQWWELQHGARPFILTEFPEIKPVVQLIDDWFTSRRLGYVFEARVGKGKLLACGIDLESDLAQRPVARQFRASLLTYVKGDSFDPKATLDIKQLGTLLRPVSEISKLGAKATASSAEKDFEASAVLDGNTDSLWHTEFSQRQPGLPHELTIDFSGESFIRAVLLTQRQDAKANGQVDEVEILDGDGKSLVRSHIPKDARSFRIPLPADSSMKTLKIRVHSSHAGAFACLAELDVEK